MQAPEPPLSASAIQILVNNHRQFLSFLERRLGARALAEDVLQEAFVKGMQRGATLDDEEAVVAWFYRTLRNALIDTYRRNGARDRGLQALASELETTTEPAQDTRDATCQCVRALSDTLKPEYADALQRVELDGLSVQGYAAERGIT